MNRSHSTSGRAGYSFLWRFVAAASALTVAIILIAPQVDLDDTSLQTLQTGGMPVALVTASCAKDLVVAPQPRLFSPEAESFAHAVSDMNCVRLI